MSIALLKRTSFLWVFPAVLLMLGSPSLSAGVIYSHTFDGSPSTALNGTTVDGGTATWTANANIKANGTSGTNQGSAWLPYAFGSGVYTLTANVNVSAAGSTNFTAISFTTASSSAFATGDLSGHTSSYATFGQRGAGDWDFWGGNGATNAVDGSSAGTFPKINTLKLVLDTTKVKWTVTASLLNASSVEVFADLNGASAGVAYTFATNPSTFTGIGFFLRAGDAIDSITLSVASVPESSTYATLVGAATLGVCLLRRRRKN